MTMKKSKDDLKKKSVEAALEWICKEFGSDKNLDIGIGSGTTIAFSFPLLSKFRNFRYVPTSRATEKGLEEQNLNIASYDSVERMKIDIDGTDEVDPEFNLLKGGGGCHNIEKKVAKKSKIFLVVCDDSKIVDHLGEKKKLPVEITKNSINNALQELSRYGNANVRSENGNNFMTDSGNLIVDVDLNRNAVSGDLIKLEKEINKIEGVIENGIFAERKADLVFIGRPEKVEILKRSQFDE